MKIYQDYDLTNNNTYKVKLHTKYFVLPNNKNELISILKKIKAEKEKYLILGNGSNIIFTSDFYNGYIICLKNMNKYNIENDTIIAESGVMLPTISLASINNSLTGLEWASAIPGTLGGSIYGNAGAYLNSIMDYIETITYLDKELNIKTIRKNDINYGYRYTDFKEDKDNIIISCTLKLNKGNKEESLKILKDRQERRKLTQPLEYPSAGSVFRNPPNNYAGKLIEDLGLKGYNINGAYISDKHANFIINKNNATGEDIVKLINYIKEKVKEKYNIELILEQEIERD